MTAKDQGFLDYGRGYKYSPYEDGSELEQQWLEGWKEARDAK